MRRTILAVAAGLAWAGVLRAQCPDGSPPPCRGARAAIGAIAVLYFDLLSRDSADAYLADGLTEQLIVRLGQVPRLTVKSRYEVQRFRGRAADVASVARALNAAYLLTGSLRKVGTRIIVTAELTRTGSPSRRLWGEVFDRASADVLDIESAIATAVAAAVAGQLDPVERVALQRRPTRDAEAYQLYQRGRALFRRGTASDEEADLRGADAFFAAALERDSLFALAWAGRAEVWIWLADNYVPGSEGYANARRYTSRALAIDSTLAVAHADRGVALVALDHDWGAAEAEERRATALAPGSSEGWTYLAFQLGGQGRVDEAYEAALRAWSADSLAAPAQGVVSWILLIRRRVDDLRSWVARADAAGFEDLATELRVNLYGTIGSDSALQFDPREVWAMARAGRAAEASASLRARAQRRDSLAAAGMPRFVSPDRLAMNYAAVGDRDTAFELIARAIDWHSGSIAIFLKSDPHFDGLRDDPRYAAALRRLNLVP